MPNLPISGLTASASNAAATDVLPVVQTAGIGPVKMTVQQMAGGLLGSTTLSGATITADAPVLNMSQTWNNAAVTFTGLKFNVASDTSAAASLLMDLQTGGTSQFSVSKGGVVRSVFRSPATGTATANLSSNTLSLGSGGSLSFSSSGDATGSFDTILTRRGTANLRLGAADTTGTTAPTPQFLSAQSWASSTTNNQTGANFTIDGSQGTGTGAGGSIIFRVAPASGTSNGVQNALVAALTINSARQVLLEDGTAAAPALSFASAPGVGIFNSSGAITFSSNGDVARFEALLGLGFRSSAVLWWTSSTNSFYSNRDLILVRDAANTLALRNGANAQTFNIYQSFADTSNFSNMSLYWSGTTFNIKPSRLGSGAFITALNIDTGASAPINFATGNVTRWFVDGLNSHFLAGADNAYDIGTNTATRPRSIYAATSITPGRGVTVATLPTPATGMIARVTDANTPVIGMTVAGGGAAYALVNYNGTNWTVIGV